MLSAVRLSSVCRLSVCNARAPYSGGCNFPQYFYGIWYLGHPLTSMENFTEIVAGEPLRRREGVKRKRGTKHSDLSKAISRKWCKIGGKLLFYNH